MRVKKRNGEEEEVDIGKVVRRIEHICRMETPTQKALTKVDAQRVAISVVQSIEDGIRTSKLDEMTAQLAQPLALEEPEYGDLAARVLVSNYHKNTTQALWTHFTTMAKRSAKQDVKGERLYREVPASIERMGEELFYWTARALWENRDPNGDPNPIISPAVFLAACSGEPDRWANYARDYQYDYAGFQMLETTYLQQASLMDASGRVYRCAVERPQHLLMRVALGIHAAAHVSGESKREWPELWNFPIRGYLGAGESRWSFETLAKGMGQAELDWQTLPDARETYEEMSRLRFTHATPTLFHAGTMRPQMSSCYLMQPGEDSIEAIGDYNKECMVISKWSGGIGSHVHNIRGHDAYICGTNGYTDGLVGMLRMINNTSEYVNQSGKRPGTHAVYLGMTHPDIMGFLQLKKQRGNEQERARHLFYGLWIPDEFMRCVVADREWHLICPNRFRKAYGQETEDYYDAKPATAWVEEANAEEYQFTHMYRRAVAEGHGVGAIPARKLWREILEILQETGGPYICFRDNVNRKSNHAHLGTVKSSNLCTEIMEYSSPTETAVCNLASICLPKFYRPGEGGMDWEGLRGTMRICVGNLNKIVDGNFYPSEKTRESNMRHRPIGVGVQGLADLFCLMGLPYDSEAARKVEFELFERLSYWALEKSVEEAQKYGEAYYRCADSPLGQGIFQWEMWQEEQKQLGREALRYPLSMDWEGLRKKVRASGARNSLLLALMPTASTSTVMGMSPCFEPYSSLVFKRRNRTGETTYVNRYFVEEMIREGRWTPQLRAQILMDRRGSIAETELPEETKARYKTAWDLPHEALTKASIVRAPFICQSQSLNQFMERPTTKQLNEIYMLGWSRGLKTASYYTRRLAPVDAQKIQVSVAAENGKENGKEGEKVEVCTRQEGCVTCSS